MPIKVSLFKLLMKYARIHRLLIRAKRLDLHVCSLLTTFDPAMLGRFSGRCPICVTVGWLKGLFKVTIINIVSFGADTKLSIDYILILHYCRLGFFDFGVWLIQFFRLLECILDGRRFTIAVRNKQMILDRWYKWSLVVTTTAQYMSIGIPALKSKYICSTEILWKSWFNDFLVHLTQRSIKIRLSRVTLLALRLQATKTVWMQLLVSHHCLRVVEVSFFRVERSNRISIFVY